METEVITGQFNDSFDPIVDGVAVAVQNYCRWLNRRLGPAYAVVPAFPGHVDTRDFPILRYFSLPVPTRPPYRYGLPWADLAFQNQLREVPFALVHAHSPLTSGPLALRLARARGIPVVATFHTKYQEDLRSIAANEGLVRYGVKKIVEVYEAADQVWAPNRATREVLREYGYRGPCEIVPNGSDIELQPPERQVCRCAQAGLGLDTSDPVLLYVGQHRWEKNLMLLIQALSLVRAGGGRFHMLLVGQGHAQEEMRRLVQSLALDDVVTFLGVIRDRERLKHCYALADLLLFPSIYDNAPLTVREAAACCLPALLIRGSAAAEGVVDGRNGFLSAGTPESYAQAILHLLQSPALLEQAGRGAHASLYRSWEEILLEVQERYLDIIRLHSAVRAVAAPISALTALRRRTILRPTNAGPASREPARRGGWDGDTAPGDDHPPGPV